MSAVGRLPSAPVIVANRPYGDAPRLKNSNALANGISAPKPSANGTTLPARSKDPAIASLMLDVTRREAAARQIWLYTNGTALHVPLQDALISCKVQTAAARANTTDAAETNCRGTLSLPLLAMAAAVGVSTSSAPEEVNRAPGARGKSPSSSNASPITISKACKGPKLPNSVMPPMRRLFRAKAVTRKVRDGARKRKGAAISTISTAAVVASPSAVGR
mmetsp:Transcript_141109/g.256520  ORF Transcript_141109/g.256520 Transcript_141109/m.256520 type:complete len:219 (+) Transcript_141109:275-931(+)